MRFLYNPVWTDKRRHVCRISSRELNHPQDFGASQLRRKVCSCGRQPTFRQTRNTVTETERLFQAQRFDLVLSRAGPVRRTLGVRIAVNKLDDGHRSHVAIAKARFQNANVTTVPILIARA